MMVSEIYGKMTLHFATTVGDKGKFKSG